MNDIYEAIANASPQVREIVERVLRLEKEKLAVRSPRHINDDILRIIKEVIQEDSSLETRD